MTCYAMLELARLCYDFLAQARAD